MLELVLVAPPPLLPPAPPLTLLAAVPALLEGECVRRVDAYLVPVVPPRPPRPALPPRREEGGQQRVTRAGGRMLESACVSVVHWIVVSKRG